MKNTLVMKLSCAEEGRMTMKSKIIMGLLLAVVLLLCNRNVFVKAADYSPGFENRDVIFYLPLKNFKVTSPFGWRVLNGKREFHNGIDIAASVGTNVYASADGTVTSVGYNSSAGNYIIISHPNGYKTKYCHLQEALVKKNEIVKVGTVIAKSGKTGRVTGPHLDFQVYDDKGKRIDPLTVLTQICASEAKVPVGYVRITTQNGNALQFDKNSGNLVVAKKDANSPEQIFEILEYENNCMFRSLTDSKMIDVCGGGYSDGTAIWAYDSNLTPAQIFYPVYYPEAKGFYLISALSEKAGMDMVIDISECNDAPNQILHLWRRYDGLLNQIFGLEPVSKDTVNKMLSGSVGEEPPVEPVINIAVTSKPIRLKKGNCFNTGGDITANEPIVKVESFIYDENDKIVDQTLDSPKAGTFYLNIKKSQINYASDYNRLKTGRYRQDIIVYTTNSKAAYSFNFEIY